MSAPLKPVAGVYRTWPLTTVAVPWAGVPTETRVSAPPSGSMSLPMTAISTAVPAAVEAVSAVAVGAASMTIVTVPVSVRPRSSVST